MASHFGTYSMLVSLALVFIFITPSLAEKHTKLKTLCSKTSNQRLCMKLMKSDSRAADSDNRGFTEVAIDLAYAKAKDIHRALNSLYEKTSEYKLKYRYSSCSKNYNDAVRDLEQAKKLFSDGEYKRIAVQVNDAAEEVQDCKSKLEKGTSGSSQLKKGSKEFEILCDVVKVASKSWSDDS